MSNSLEQLKAAGTIVVNDSGDFETIGKYKPQDATANPSLILAASAEVEYSKLIDAAVVYGKEHGEIVDDQVDATLDSLLAEFGNGILKIVPRKISTEVAARFSFDKQGSTNKALHIIDLYKAQGILKGRDLIKIASTCKGIYATRVLQNDYGVKCNLTLMFSLPQAICAAETGAFLTSPFYKASTNNDNSKEEDLGVASVKAIFNYYKKFGYKTIVMGAFRNISEITELAGCDYLTIAPKLLEKLFESSDAVPKKFDAASTARLEIEKKSYLDDESLFRFDFNEDQMAVEKLRGGNSKFAADAEKLKAILKEKIEA